MEEILLVAIDAFPEVRYDRLLKRGREGDPKNWEEFWIQDQRDLIGYLEGTGQDVRGCFKIAQYKIDNNGILDEFRKSVSRYSHIF